MIITINVMIIIITMVIMVIIITIINYHRHTIDKENVSPLCRMCGERNETVAHLVSECTKLTQKQYKEWRGDTMLSVELSTGECALITD